MPLNLPNILTVTRIILIFVALVLATNSGIPGGVKVKSDDIEMILRYIAFSLALVAAVTDLADGYLARKWNQVTDFGALMDPLADKVLVYAAFVLMIPALVPAWMFIIILAREFTISGMRTVAASEGIVVAAGMSGKIKTVLQMIAVPLLIIAPAFPEFRPLWWAAQAFLWASLVMTVYSGVEYVMQNKQVFSMK